jgi:hypothetical protein
MQSAYSNPCVSDKRFFDEIQYWRPLRQIVVPFQFSFISDSFTRREVLYLVEDLSLTAGTYLDYQGLRLQ